MNSKTEPQLCKCGRSYKKELVKMDSDLNMTTVYTDCDCCFEDYDREYNKTVKKTETFRECKIGKVYHNADLSEVDSDLRKEIQSSSYLYGKTGTGKTYIAVAKFKDDLEHDRKATFTTVANLLARIKHSYSCPDNIANAEDIIEYYSTIPILYLDDLGADKESAFVEATLEKIIDYRYSNQLRTIITSNLSLSGLSEYLGDRLASRISGLCKLVEVKGNDKRLEQ